MCAAVDGFGSKALSVCLAFRGLIRRFPFDFSFVNVARLGIIVALSYFVIVVVNTDVMAWLPFVLWDFWKLRGAHCVGKKSRGDLAVLKLGENGRRTTF